LANLKKQEKVEIMKEIPRTRNGVPLVFFKPSIGKTTKEGGRGKVNVREDGVGAKKKKSLVQEGT